jgi:ribosome-associated protein
MHEQTFQLQPDQDFIPLNSLLKVLHLVGTGGEANIRIDNGEVLLNGTTETRRRKKLRSGDVVLFENVKIRVV